MTSTRSIHAAFEPSQIWDDDVPTPLIQMPGLARQLDIGRVFVKLENERPLGNFKALGGMVAGLRALAAAVGVTSLRDLISARTALPQLVCASDGNHGLAVAAAAQRAGAPARIYLPACVSPARAQRIEALGAEVVRVAGTYDDAVRDAALAAERGNGLLIADTSADPDDAVVRDVMAGYALLTDELIAQFRDEVHDRPSHLFVQAGVGGLAAAMAAGLWEILQEPRRLVVVQPEAAACVARALKVGRPLRISGDLHTCAQMLSCGLASAPALQILKRHDARSVLVREDQLDSAVHTLRAAGGPHSTPSGAAGLAGLLHVAADADLRDQHRLDLDSAVLLVVTEGSAAAPA